MRSFQPIPLPPVTTLTSYFRACFRFSSSQEEFIDRVKACVTDSAVSGGR